MPEQGFRVVCQGFGIPDQAIQRLLAIFSQERHPSESIRKCGVFTLRRLGPARFHCRWQRPERTIKRPGSGWQQRASELG